MGKESAPNFKSDQIEKKEILREVGGEPTEPMCLRRIINEATGRFLDAEHDGETLAQLDHAIIERINPGRYVLGCQIEDCARLYAVNAVGVLTPEDVSGVCLEAAVQIARRILPNPDDKF